MPRFHGKYLKCCENVFAFIVISACVFTLMASFSHPPVIHSGKNTKSQRHSVLRQARENFRYAMNKLQNSLKFNKTITLTADTNIQPAVPIIRDPFLDWFRERDVVKHHESKPHPIIQQELISNSDMCSSSPVDVFIYFQSRWDNFKIRSLLRETWAGTNTFKDIRVKTLFILGKPPKSQDQLKINAENLMHKDILQGNFIDSFANLTMKSISALKWINENCIQAKYIMKADDDMFVNIFAAIEYLITQIYDKKKVVMCHVKENNTSPIIRDPKSRWYVPDKVFPNRSHFPTFCSGYVALFTGDLIPQLYKASFTAPYFSVDDGYLFGLLMQSVPEVEFIDIKDHMTLNQKVGLEEYQGKGPLVHVAVNAWEDGALEKFWQSTLMKLTNWARDHANVVVVQGTKATNVV